MTKINCDTQITSSAADTSGLQLTNLTSTSPVTAGAQSIGVDAAGNVVNVAPADICSQSAALPAAAGVACTDTIILSSWAACATATLEDIFNFFHSGPVDPNNCLA